MFDVIMITVFLKSTVRPRVSVKRPSSRICSRILNTSGCAFSISSNIGASYLQAEGVSSPEAFAEATDHVMEALRQHFRPEFLNRVDDVIVFKPLGEEQLTHIIELRLDDLRKLLAERKITIELTQPAKEMLFLEGYDRAYGARPAKAADPAAAPG